MIKVDFVKVVTAFVVLNLLIPGFVSKCETTDTTKIGIYVTSIYDLDYQNSSFSSDYWMWRLNSKREFKESYFFEGINSKKIDTLFSSTQWPDQSENIVIHPRADTTFWDYDRFTAVFKHEFDVRKYPFDEEILVMEFEGITYYDDWVKLAVDNVDSGSKHLTIDGWEIGQMKVDTFKVRYQTSFGSPGDRTPHSYAGFRVTIPIKREGWALFLKLFAGVFVAFVIALFSLKINITEADGRFGVCVGALFATLANMYIVNSNLPLESKFTFMDKLHIQTVVIIVSIFIVSTFSLRFFKAGQLKKSENLDKGSFYFAIASFVAGVFIFFPY